MFRTFLLQFPFPVPLYCCAIFLDEISFITLSFAYPWTVVFRLPLSPLQSTPVNKGDIVLGFVPLTSFFHVPIL